MSKYFTPESDLPSEEPENVDVDQLGLFADFHDEHWQGMPEWSHEFKTHFKQITITLETEADWKAFQELIGQQLTIQTKSTWWPDKNATRSNQAQRYIDENQEPLL